MDLPIFRLSGEAITGSCVIGNLVSPPPSPILTAAWILQFCRINSFETVCPRFRDLEWNVRLADGPHYLLVDGERLSRFGHSMARAIILLEQQHDGDESLISQLRRHSFDRYDFDRCQFMFGGDSQFSIVSFEPCD